MGFGETGVLSAIHLNERYSKHYQITAVSTKPSLVSGQELGTRLATPELWKKNYYTDFKDYKYLEGVNILHGKVTHLSPDEKAVMLQLHDEGSSETTLNYDVLLIATGVSNGFWRCGDIETDSQIQQSIKAYSKMFQQAKTVAVVGGGPSGASCSYHLKSCYPDKQVHYFFSGQKPLPHHHLGARKKVLTQLNRAGVHLHRGHRAVVKTTKTITHEPIQWSTGQPAFTADLVLWTLGQTRANSDFLPQKMLDEQGFVNVNNYLQVPDAEGVFCVGDIANTDSNRSSARNFAFKLVADNIHYYACGKPQKMRVYRSPKYRWGSVLGVQEDGMRVFTAKGQVFRFPLWSVERILFPVFVRKGLYRGVIKQKP